MDKQPIQGLTWPVRKIETDILDDDTTVELPYWTTITSDEIFKDKKVLVISLPFAYDNTIQRSYKIGTIIQKNFVKMELLMILLQQDVNTIE